MTRSEIQSVGSSRWPICYGDVPPEGETRAFDFSVTVLFTTAQATLEALRAAFRLAGQLGGRISVLVAYVVPYPLPLDLPQTDPAFRLREFLASCEEAPLEARVDVRLCRRARQCIRESLPPSSVLLIGGREGWWPFTFERRLARELVTAGHQVLFVGARRKFL